MFILGLIFFGGDRERGWGWGSQIRQVKKGSIKKKRKM